MSAGPIWIALALVMAGSAPALAQPAASAAGEALYEAKCGGCHSIDANRIGPRHRDVVERKVASLRDFNYSEALKQLGGVWTVARLDAWLQNPQKMAPGARMF